MLLPLLLAGCAWLSEAELDKLRDGDADGVPSWTDCNDGDAAIGGPSPRFLDLDSDGLGGAAVDACPDQGAALAGDCDDTDSAVGLAVDWYPDADADGLLGSTATRSCAAPAAGWEATPGEDCDDEDASVGAPSTLYADADGDGHGDPATGLRRCPGGGLTANADDCDDTDAHAYPDAPQDICAGTDANCDGLFDVEESYRAFSLGGPDDLDAPPGLGTSLAYGALDGAGATLVAGAPDAGTVVLYALERGHTQTTAQRFASIQDEGFGTALAVGDAFVDEYGAGDVIVGAGGWAAGAGMVAIFDVPPGGGDLDASAARVTWEGTSPGDGVGSAMTFIEGVNGFHTSLLVVGGPGANAGKGVAWILDLTAGGMAGAYSMYDATFEITAEVGGADFGLGTATGAYPHPDGAVQVLSTAPGFDGSSGRADAGAVFMTGYGGADVLDGAAPTWVGSRSSERAGGAVAAGDLTGDGVPELIVSAPDATYQLHEGAGVVYVLDGADVLLNTGAVDQELASAMLIVGGDAPGRGLGRSLLVVEATQEAPEDQTQYLLMGAHFGDCEDFGAVYRWVPVADGTSGSHEATEAHHRLTGARGSGLGSALANGGPYGPYDMIWVGNPDEARVSAMTFSTER
ncbi:MAG: FG-GAP repeat protein [Pseudomonadota bacterium]|nr:FG-GAP repeat protein [Pseudomonadota bacterium]